MPSTLLKRKKPSGSNLIRVSIAIKNADKIRPVLMHVDRDADTIKSLC